MNIVVKQVESYNLKDLEKFLECYTEDIRVYMLQTGNEVTNGKEQLSNIMKQSFESDPEAKTEIVDSMTQGNLVIQIEKVSNHGGKTIQTISIYEIRDEKISQLWFGGRTELS